ncbi:DUF2971 domain-containing protein [Cellulomonas sp.]|uniref:DUF2971 domain-containing protein n=1 Tax=Cellulomonas sp. TaxID=40001 RepID=UPI003BAA69A0
MSDDQEIIFEGPDGPISVTVDAWAEGTGLAQAALGPIEDQKLYSGTLWHYTNVTNAKLILESGRMWATDCDYLNDPSETRGLALMTSAVAQKRMLADPNPVNSTLNSICDLATIQLWTTYVISFSTRANDLSQWRYYGDDGAGYALGFDASKMGGTVAVDGLPGDQSALLVRCEYPFREDLEAVANQLLDAAAGTLAPGIIPATQLMANLILGYGFAIGGPKYKPPGFEGESEVRLVALMQPRQIGVLDKRHFPGRRVRARRGMFVPYVEADLADSLTQIVGGPKLFNDDKERALYGLQSLVDGAGVPDMQVSLDPQPYRGA